MTNISNAVAGNGASSTLSLILDRARCGSRRGSRTDDFHLALVVECGGMRGIAASGFLRVLGDKGLLDSFDTLHGSSAGACAAAYFLARQESQGVGIYDDIGTRKVVNPYRIFSQPCMVDTDYIVDEVMSHRRRLDVSKIIDEPGVLNIVTTAVPDGRPVVHRKFETGDNVLLALKATLRVPGPFEHGIEIDGMRHIDGGIAAPIPIFSAIDVGATHILVVCTQRQQDYTGVSKFSQLEGLVLRILYGRKVQQAYLGSQGIERHRPIVEGGAASEIDILVRPEGSIHCSWFTVDKCILTAVEEESAQVAKAYIHQADTQLATAARE